MGGPPPKRSDQRRRRNKDVVPITTAPSGAEVAIPAPAEHWQPIVTEWYRSLAQSGQSAFYQASDWATAVVWSEVLHRALSQGARPSPGLVAAWASGAADLLATEASRRRMRIELARAGVVDDDEHAAVSALDKYRARLRGPDSDGA